MKTLVLLMVLLAGCAPRPYNPNAYTRPDGPHYGGGGGFSCASLPGLNGSQYTQCYNMGGGGGAPMQMQCTTLPGLGGAAYTQCY